MSIALVSLHRISLNKMTSPSGMSIFRFSAHISFFCGFFFWGGGGGGGGFLGGRGGAGLFVRNDFAVLFVWFCVFLGFFGGGEGFGFVFKLPLSPPPTPFPKIS